MNFTATLTLNYPDGDKTILLEGNGITRDKAIDAVFVLANQFLPIETTIFMTIPHPKLLENAAN